MKSAVNNDVQELPHLFDAMRTEMREQLSNVVKSIVFSKV